MKTRFQVYFLVLTLCAGGPCGALAIERYVSPTGGHLAPFTDWATAATNIQAAIDAAAPGDTVWVTNGVYSTGGKVVAGGYLTNRVALTKALVVQSVNGPAATFIVGGRTPNISNGPVSVRCAWLTNGATLSGFTLTNGSTLSYSADYNGGGAYCRGADALLTNCVLSGNSAAGSGGGVYQGTLWNCTLQNNAAALQGGGAYNAWLNYSTLQGNSAPNGGGVYNSSNGVLLTTCTFLGNSASSAGGGVYQGTLWNCTLQNNTAAFQGGGGYLAGFLNCTLQANTARDGAGAYNSFLTNCALVGNWATNTGGGALLSPGRLQNCTVVANRANIGGGLAGGSAVNSVLYFNSASTSGPNYNNSALTNCCTSPLPGSGSANVMDLDPRLGGDGIHLQADSPCLGRGASAGLSGNDLDGQP